MFNKTEIFNNKVLPYILQIKSICTINQIPFYSVFATTSKDNQVCFLSPVDIGISLTQDKILYHIEFDKKRNIVNKNPKLEFNKKDVYKNEIFPLMIEVNALCVIHQIPYFSVYAIANTENKSQYKTYYISPYLLERKLNNDIIGSHAVIHSGNQDDVFTKVNIDDFGLILPENEEEEDE